MITQPRMLFEDMRSPPLPQRRGLTRPASSAASSAAAKMLAAAFGVLLLLEGEITRQSLVKEHHSGQSEQNKDHSSIR